MFLGLPDGSSTTQEMDQCHGSFQPACHRSMVCVTSEKIAERMLARKKGKSNRERPEASDLCDLTEEQFSEDIEEHGGPFEEDDGKMTIIV